MQVVAVAVVAAAVALVWVGGGVQGGGLQQQSEQQPGGGEGEEGPLAREWVWVQVWGWAQGMRQLLRMEAAAICSSLSPPLRGLSLRWMGGGRTIGGMAQGG